MEKVKFRLFFFIICFLACTLQAVANDTIVLSSKNKWVQQHYIRATVGEQFKVIYGDGMQQTYIGTGENQPIEYLYSPPNYNMNDIACTIIALSENCKFTWFKQDGHTTFLDLSRCPSIVGLWAGNIATKALTNLNLQNCINLEVLRCSHHPLYNLDISDCKALKELVCAENHLSSLVLHDSVMLEGFQIYNNHLSLSNMYAIVLQTSPPPGYGYGYCCCQKLPQIDVEIGEPVDFSSENVIGGVYTQYWVSRDGQPVTDNDFTFENGVFTFHYFGNYLVQRLNPAIPCLDGSFVSNLILVKSNASDATLAFLKVSNCSSIQFELNPEYRWNIYNYEVDVNYSTSSVCISATPSFVSATVSGNGTFPLEVGENIFPIIVTSADGTAELEYTVTVNRATPGADATLLNLAVSEGELTPEFNNTIHDYTVDVAYSISSINITATANDPKATISGTGWKQLEVGENIYIITVTAQDGITTLEYTVTVNRTAPSTDATLLNLAVSEGELAPEFSDIIYDYTVDVAYSISSINITATTNDPNASISGTGNKQLAVGENIYTITVTAQDGITELDYVVTVTRSVGVLENTLEGIGIYPNPTTGELRITSYELRIEKIEIIDIAGKKIFSSESITFPEATIDISHLQAGTYFLKVITEKGEVIKKVGKQ